VRPEEPPSEHKLTAEMTWRMPTMPDTIAVRSDTPEKAASSWDEDLTKTTKERWAWYMALEEQAKERDSAS
jgi:hypothetical protein